MQKVKILESWSSDKLSKKVEKFINSHNVVDIKYSYSNSLFTVDPYTVMIFYESDSQKNVLWFCNHSVRKSSS